MLTKEQEIFLAAFADKEIEKEKLEQERIIKAEAARIKQEELILQIEAIKEKKKQETLQEIETLQKALNTGE